MCNRLNWFRIVFNTNFVSGVEPLFSATWTTGCGMIILRQILGK